MGMITRMTVDNFKGLYRRNADEDVEVYSVADVPEIRERLKYLMLGELVYNEGEQELVEEIRHHAHSHS
jgi:hypothetical protein